jgi:predicted ester cyclase
MRPGICPADSADLALRARGALERVCSGKGLDPSDRYYAPTFVDHVNDLEFRGVEGTRQSVGLYRKVLDDIDVKVEEQVVEGNRVTSRFVVTGRSGDRRVRFNGITISRFENGKIVEDWSVTDTLGLLRQLGPWRSVLLGLRSWRAVKAAR